MIHLQIIIGKKHLHFGINNIIVTVSCKILTFSIRLLNKFCQCCYRQYKVLKNKVKYCISVYNDASRLASHYARRLNRLVILTTISPTEVLPTLFDRFANSPTSHLIDSVSPNHQPFSPTPPFHQNFTIHMLHIVIITSYKSPN